MPCVKCACSELKLAKTSAYFLRFDIKLKKSRSVLDLDTVLISKQAFFQHHALPVYQGKSYLHGIALPDFYIVSPFFFTKDQNKREYLLLFGFSVTLPLPRKVPDVTKEQIYVDAILR